jgi:hypothetical protein
MKCGKYSNAPLYQKIHSHQNYSYHRFFKNTAHGGEKTKLINDQKSNTMVQDKKEIDTFNIPLHKLTIEQINYMLNHRKNDLLNMILRTSGKTQKSPKEKLVLSIDQHTKNHFHSMKQFAEKWELPRGASQLKGMSFKQQLLTFPYLKEIHE